MCVSFWDKTLFACLANFLSISRAGAASHSCAQELGHSGEYGNGAKLVGKMSKSVMQLISIYFLNLFSFLTMKIAMSKLKMLF